MLTNFLSRVGVIYKKLDIDNSLTVKANINLIGHQRNGNFGWFDAELLYVIPADLKSCFEFSCAIHNELQNNIQESWYPIRIEQGSTAVIYMRSTKLSREQQVMLKYFCRIYENDLSTLKESEFDKLTG